MYFSYFTIDRRVGIKAEDDVHPALFFQTGYL